MAPSLLSPGFHGRPSESQELILRAALLDEERAAAAWRRWKQVDAVATTDQDSGRLFPLVCRNLLALGVDDPELPVLKSAYRHQWVANQHRLARAGEALVALSGAGIETMVLKGAALAERHYGDVGLRLMYDVDVLVRPEAAREAAAVLGRSGWEQLVAPELDDLLPVVQGTMFQDRLGQRIDLHWHVMWSPAPEDDFWDAAEPVEVGGARTLLPCLADQLLHVCVHGVWSDGEPVRWVADTVSMLRATPDMDWDRVVARARARALSLPLLDALTYLREAFDVEVPDDVVRSLRDTPRGMLEGAGHAAWRLRPAKLRTAALTLERYRRHRRLPPGPTRAPTLRAYLRSWASMMWGAQSDLDLLRGLVTRLRPGRSGPGTEHRTSRFRAAARTPEPGAPRPR